MTTFERYLVEDKASWEEHKNPYYKYTVHGDACRRILEEFGLNPEVSHIVNGHVPVKTKDGENPVKATASCCHRRRVLPCLSKNHRLPATP